MLLTGEESKIIRQWRIEGDNLILISKREKAHDDWINGVCMINQNMLLTGDQKGIIRQWRIEDDNLILVSKKENAHDDDITSLVNLGNGHIASSSFDNTIKIW